MDTEKKRNCDMEDIGMSAVVVSMWEDKVTPKEWAH
jgi:hypothetical protein